jgi:hypothetical protein
MSANWNNCTPSHIPQFDEKEFTHQQDGWMVRGVMHDQVSAPFTRELCEENVDEKLRCSPEASHDKFTIEPPFGGKPY